MTDRPHPEQGFRTCLGILALEKTYGRAPGSGLRARRPDQGPLGHLDPLILKAGLDRAFLGAEPEPQPLRHGNIRGRGYFH